MALLTIQQFDINTEERLLQESERCNIISHMPSIGASREKIIADEIRSRFSHLKVHEGFICSDFDNYESSQIDVLICKPDAHIREIPPHVLVEPEDVIITIEVKSSLAKEHLVELNDLILKIKALYNVGEIKVGIFAYRATVSQETLLEYFGIKYDFTYGTYEESDRIICPFVDFVTVLDTKHRENYRKPFLISKDRYGKFQWVIKSPIIGMFMTIVKSTY